MTFSLLLSFVLAILLITCAVALVYEVLFFIISLKKERNDVVDVSWGFGFVCISFFWLAIIPEPSLSFVIALLLVSIWGIRLTYHIWNRFMKKKVEDRRYVEMKKDWKWVKTRSFFQVFFLQAVLMSVIILPVVLHANSGVTTPWLLIIVGVFLWMLGFYYQVVGDFQLGQFIASKPKKGLMMREGLWSKTRHPNYFGEMSMWWGIYLITLSSFNLWYILFAAIGPVVITLLLRYVSGVPMLEKHWEKTYGKEFEDYKESTPMLIPNFFNNNDDEL